ncbi:adenine deaminase [soil metagenome]
MPQYNFTVKGNVVDIKTKRIFGAEIHIVNKKISSIKENPGTVYNNFILPGFIDSHVHIESSMITPAEFARMAVVHGTVATVSDPHEIANVCGAEGVEFMINNGKKVPFKFNFGAPSCVPATFFETSGASLNSQEVGKLLEKNEIKYLSEMMNFPGVLNKDQEVMRKIKAAIVMGKPVDGHAPGLRGEQANAYIAAGITTDHECFTAEEALDKLKYGMKILIREGSAAKNFEALIELLHTHPNEIMFCSDDKHPDSLAAGHINQLCARAVAKGIDIFKVLQAACVNPVLHYKLDVGLLQTGDAADFIVVKDLSDFEVLQTYINGELVADNGKSLIKSVEETAINKFQCDPVTKADLNVTYNNQKEIPVIEALDGQLITNKLYVQPLVEDGCIVSDTTNDILKIIVVNRYKKAPVAKAFIKNFNLKQGAIASTVAHDSHNIIAVGADDASLIKAINMVIAQEGGVSCVSNHDELVLPLPVAGLMSLDDGYKVAETYTAIDKMAKGLGSTLSAPFMTLSFMALLVIPHLKLSDKGLFDGDSFCFVEA